MDTIENHELNSNGHDPAPPILHEALDRLYRWMAENGAPDGMTTIGAAPYDGSQPFCVDLSMVAYFKKKEEEPPVEPAAGDPA